MTQSKVLSLARYMLKSCTLQCIIGLRQIERCAMLICLFPLIRFFSRFSCGGKGFLHVFSLFGLLVFMRVSFV